MELKLIFAFCALVGLSAAQTGILLDKSIVCPVHTKSLYDSTKEIFDVDKFDFNLCTQVVVLDKYWYDAQEPWSVEDANREKDFKQITDLYFKYPHLKITLGINRNIVDYINSARNKDSIELFITNAAVFAARYDFDGLHLFWSYSSDRLLEPYVGNFVKLVSRLNEKLNETTRHLTATYVVGNDLEEYNFPELSNYYDHITTVYAYSNANSANYALKARNISHIEEMIDDLTAMDISPSKILLGLPFESPQFLMTLHNSVSKFEGMVNYHSICRTWANENELNWLKSFNSEAGLAFAQTQKYHTGEVHSIVYDSSRSLANKLRYAMKKGLGGAMTDVLHKDDFTGRCDLDKDTWEDYKPADGVVLSFPERKNSTHALLKTINEAMEVSLDEVNQENKPNSSPSHNTVGLMVLISGMFAFFLF